MKPDEQIIEKSKVIMKIIAHADDLVSKLEQFFRILTEQGNSLFDKYELLHIIRFAFWDLAILEVCKLFNQNEKFSLNKILKNVLINYSKIEWKSKVDETEFRNFLEQLEKQKSLIKRLKSIRDHYIAHYDNTKTIDSLVVSELRDLLDLSQKIYNKIELGITGSDMMWDSKDDSLDMKMIKNLSKYEELRIFILTNEINRTEFIQTDALIKIMV